MTECSRGFEFQSTSRKVRQFCGSSAATAAVLLRGVELKMGLLERLAGCFRLSVGVLVAPVTELGQRSGLSWLRASDHDRLRLDPLHALWRRPTARGTASVAAAAGGASTLTGSLGLWRDARYGLAPERLALFRGCFPPGSLLCATRPAGTGLFHGLPATQASRACTPVNSSVLTTRSPVAANRGPPVTGYRCRSLRVKLGVFSRLGTATHQAKGTVDWRFTTPEARIKLKRLYPSIQLG